MEKIDDIINELESVCFELVKELPPEGKPLTIYIHDGSEYIYINGHFDEIGKIEIDLNPTFEIIQEQAPQEKPPTNCKNCGAVLKGHVCEYCGTRY